DEQDRAGGSWGQARRHRCRFGPGDDRGGLRAFGRLDALINNAALYGALHGGRFDGIDEAEWDAAMAVNVKGIWNCCKAAVPAMRKADGGSIINIASLAATYGIPSGLPYAASQAGRPAVT